MLVRRRQHEKKEKGTDEGWPLTARTIDIPLETLLQNRSCNETAVSVNSAVVELRGQEDGMFTY